VPEASPQSADARAADAWRAAACLAIDPHGLGGAVLRGDAGEQCERWLDALRALLPSDEQLRRVPAHIDDERLMGGTDLPASLRLGRAIHARGVLEELSAGFLLLPMAVAYRPAAGRPSRFWGHRARWGPKR
jgi:magnesium chelatase subunit D